MVALITWECPLINGKEVEDSKQSQAAVWLFSYVFPTVYFIMMTGF